MSKTENATNFDTLTPADVAELLDVSEKTVRNWMNKCELPFTEGARGRVMKWSDAREWYVLRRIEDSGKLGKSGNSVKKTAPAMEPGAPAGSDETYNEALTRKTIADANLRELELAAERGDVVAVADVEQSIAKVATSLKTAILALPAKLVTRLYGVKDRNAMRAILDIEARDLCAKLATIGQESAPEPARIVVDE